jgi:hypothetical protein
MNGLRRAMPHWWMGSALKAPSSLKAGPCTVSGYLLLKRRHNFHTPITWTRENCFLPEFVVIMIRSVETSHTVGHHCHASLSWEPCIPTSAKKTWLSSKHVANPSSVLNVSNVDTKQLKSHKWIKNYNCTCLHSCCNNSIWLLLALRYEC